jgi:hypothetical protein
MLCYQTLPRQSANFERLKVIVRTLHGCIAGGRKLTGGLGCCMTPTNVVHPFALNWARYVRKPAFAGR